MPPQTDSDLILIAEALRLRRSRLAESASQELGEPSSFLDKATAAGKYAGAIVNELNRGLLSILPAAAREKFQEHGMGVETEFSGTAAGAGTRFAGSAMPFMFAPIAFGTTTTIKGVGAIRSIINDITKFALSNPKTYFTAEAAGAFGAGAAGESAKQGGAGPGWQLAAEFTGGMGLGGLTSVGPRSLRALREGFQANILPMTRQGGEIRAARQTQQRAGGPETAKAYAQSLAEIPEGVTPAQWIGDERLMAQESRLLRDNPELADQVRAELQEAHLAAQESLRDSFGRPRTRQDWEVSVLERVTPEGTLIEPGMTDNMLDQAYDSFAPLYDQAKGFTLEIPMVKIEQPLGIRGGALFEIPPIEEPALIRRMVRSINSEDIIADPQSRSSVSGWINNASKEFEDEIVNGTLSSDAILSLRSRIRGEIRRQQKGGNIERADLLHAAEGDLTTVLMNGLPEETSAMLRVTDSQYRKYKIVENAIFNAADANLSPEQLSQSIRMGGLTSQSRYARGTDEATQELRRLALAGRSTEEVLGDPQRAAMFVRDLTDVERQAVQADFTDVLFNRAKSAAATESGIPLLSGEKLLLDLTENMDVMKNLGMTTNDITRLRTIGKELQAIAKKSPAAVEQLFEDGPASILQLGAAIIGAHGGQRLAGGGLGASLVLAQFMSNRARNFLARMTSDQAARLMKDAATDPKLYQALLTRSTVTARVARERAAYLESWLLASAFDKASAQEEGMGPGGQLTAEMVASRAASGAYSVGPRPVPSLLEPVQKAGENNARDKAGNGNESTKSNIPLLNKLLGSVERASPEQEAAEFSNPEDMRYGETKIGEDSPTGEPLIFLNERKYREAGALEGFQEKSFLGEALHNLKNIEPERYSRLLTAAFSSPEYMRWAQESYQRAKSEGETRNFQDWHTHSRFDQVIAGFLFAGDPALPTLKLWSRDLPFGEPLKRELLRLGKDLGIDIKNSEER